MSTDKTLKKYIDEYWNQAAVSTKTSRWGNARNLVMHIGRIPLPYPTVSPNHEYFAGTQYYWDSYFTIIGLLDGGKKEAAKAMVDNLMFLFRKFGFMPARNTIMSFGRTQPPLFTRMVWEVYEAGAADDSWLDKAMEIAQQEYHQSWQNKRRLDAESGLSRYRPWLFKKLLTTYESGWDVSSRFALGKTTLLPVDLNCLLYVYESDIEKWHKLRGHAELASKWREAVRRREAAISTYFWDDGSGFFYDFDQNEDSREELMTLAGFFPLWCGAATKSQAEACRSKIKVFLQPYGLATTEKMAWKHRQWDYPNGWPPLHLIVVEGLKRYGFNEEAADICSRWLSLNESVYKKTGRVWEKYDVVRGRKGKRGRYPTQEGFSWTNGVYLRLLKLSTGK